MTSSSVVQVTIGAMGPKISSCTTSASAGTSTRTVGGKKKPLLLAGTDAWWAILAPAATALSSSAVVSSTALALISGPMSEPSLAGPTVNASTFAPSLAVNSAATSA